MAHLNTFLFLTSKHVGIDINKDWRERLLNALGNSQYLVFPSKHDVLEQVEMHGQERLLMVICTYSISVACRHVEMVEIVKNDY